ncbi:MAG TPA: hypothetical protein GX401_05715 [Clostridiales bacterium]|nr:hypothetical protein [Clostridiales bacterium]
MKKVVVSVLLVGMMALSSVGTASAVYNNTRIHRAGVYTPRSGWVFSSMMNRGSVAYVARYQATANKSVSCGAY